MVVYVPRLERRELDDELEAQVLSQEVVVMRDGAWVFLYNNKRERCAEKYHRTYCNGRTQQGGMFKNK